MPFFVFFEALDSKKLLIKMILWDLTLPPYIYLWTYAEKI
jgi:hypothetical protein